MVLVLLCRVPWPLPRAPQVLRKTERRYGQALTKDAKRPADPTTRGSFFYERPVLGGTPSSPMDGPRPRQRPSDRETFEQLHRIAVPLGGRNDRRVAQRVQEPLLDDGPIACHHGAVERHQIHVDVRLLPI